jgi:amidase
VILGKTNVLGLGDWQATAITAPQQPGRSAAPGGSSGSSSAALAAELGAVDGFRRHSLRVRRFLASMRRSRPLILLLTAADPPSLPPLPFDRDPTVIRPMAQCSRSVHSMRLPNPLSGPARAKVSLPPSRHDGCRIFACCDRHRSALMETDQASARALGAGPISPKPASRSNDDRYCRLRRLDAALYACCCVFSRHPAQDYAGADRSRRVVARRRWPGARRGIALSHRDWLMTDRGPPPARTWRDCSGPMMP